MLLGIEEPARGRQCWGGEEGFLVGTAGEKELGKKAGSEKRMAEKEGVKDEKPRAINLDDHYSIKRVLDDAVSEVCCSSVFFFQLLLFELKP
jgi:hypothetical protein